MSYTNDFRKLTDNFFAGMPPEGGPQLMELNKDTSGKIRQKVKERQTTGNYNQMSSDFDKIGYLNTSQK